MAEQPKMNPAMMSASRTMGSTEPTVHEIFTLINNAKIKSEKIAILKKHDTQAMRQLIKAAFDPKIEWDIPEGTPPFMANEAPVGTEHTYLEDQATKLFHFIKGGDGELSKVRKETLFIQTLEGLHETEAKLLINIKDKTVNKVYKGLTEAVVKEAFGWNDNFMLPESK